MARIQLTKFYFESTPASPRSAKAPFAAVAPALVARFGRRSSNVNLDTIAEEDGMAESRGDSNSATLKVVSSPSISFSPSIASGAFAYK